MLYGRDKYESFQDTNPYKHLLIRMVSAAMRDARDSTEQAGFAADALRLLKIDIPFAATNFPQIREKLQELVSTMPAEGTAPYIPEDELVFLLRGADPLGHVVGQLWVDKATSKGVSGARIKSAQEQVDRMREYHFETRPADLDDF